MHCWGTDAVFAHVFLFSDALFVVDRFCSSFAGLVQCFAGQPLSYLPLSLWPWQEVIKAVYQDRVQVVAVYPNAAVRSPGRSYELPSVIALREYRPVAGGLPAFTRFNVFLRDDFSCQVRTWRSPGCIVVCSVLVSPCAVACLCRGSSGGCDALVNIVPYYARL